MIKLQNKVEIIIPKEDNNGQEIKDLMIEWALEKITNTEGGCTITDVRGQWHSDKEGIMTDNNANYEWYYSSHTSSFDKVEPTPHLLFMIADELISNYGQEAVSIKINGTLYIIFKEDLVTLEKKLNEFMF